MLIGNSIGLPFCKRWNRLDISIPTLVSSEVGNVADDKIVLTYNERLDSDSTPATTDFVVYGTSETVDSVAVSGRTVTLTMTDVISELETIFISYTAGANPIRDRTGNNAADLVTQYVANHTTTYLRDENGDLITGEGGAAIPIGKREDDGTAPYFTYYQTLYDSLTTPPSSDTADLQNELVKTIVGSGAWSTRDLFHLFAQENNADGEALKNWIDPTKFNAASVVAPTFTSLKGFTGNAVDQYLQANFTPNVDGVNYTQNSASLGVLVNEHTASSVVTTGGHKNASSPYSGLTLNTRLSTALNGTGRLGLNNARNSSAYNVTGLGHDRRGLWILNRSASGEVKVYKNGQEIATQTMASVALSSIKPLILASQLDAAVALFSDEQVSAYFLGGALTPSQITSIHGAFRDYMQANNTGQHLADEITVVAKETDKHYGFSDAFYIGERMFCFYRDGTSHNSFDGVCYMIYSDDDGLTWSSATEVYDGSELITSEVLSEDPAATADVRDFRVLLLDNGTMVLCGFVAIGHNDPDIHTRVLHSAWSFCIQIPYTGTTLNLAGKTINYITTEGEYFGGGLVYKDSVLYATTYSDCDLYKSLDYGSTWELVSTIFSAGLAYNATECALVFVGSTMYAIGRNAIITSGVIARSVDNGENWTDYTEVSEHISRPGALKLDDDKVLVTGRGEDDDIVYYKLDGLAISGDVVSLKYCRNEDIGYGGLVRKNGKCYFFYSDGDEQTVDWLFDGIYFKAIDESNL